MYTREEAAAVRRQFWTSFGQYMKPVTNADGEPANWLNYKTGIKHLFFRMDAGKRQASVAVEVSHPDESMRLYYFGQFESMRKVFEEQAGEQWGWQKEVYDEDGRQISRIITVLDGVNILTRDDWPAMISFFKPRIIALDSFWSLAREMFVV